MGCDPLGNATEKSRCDDRRNRRDRTVNPIRKARLVRAPTLLRIMAQLDRSLFDGVLAVRPFDPSDRDVLLAGRDDEFHRFLGEGSPGPTPLACICISTTISPVWSWPRCGSKEALTQLTRNRYARRGRTPIHLWRFEHDNHDRDRPA